MNRVPEPPPGVDVRDVLVRVLNHPGDYNVDGDDEVALYRDGYLGQLHSSPFCILKPDAARRAVSTVNELAQNTPADWCDNCVIFEDGAVAELASIGIVDAWMASNTAANVSHIFSYRAGVWSFVPAANLDAILDLRSRGIIAALATAHPDSEAISEAAQIISEYDNRASTDEPTSASQPVTVAVLGSSDRDSVAWKAAGRYLHHADSDTARLDGTAVAENVAVAMLAATLVAQHEPPNAGEPRSTKPAAICLRNTDRRAADLLGEGDSLLVISGVELNAPQRQIAAGLHANGMGAGAAMELGHLIGATGT